MRILASILGLMLLATAVRADDPEPPGKEACKVFGKWRVEREINFLKRRIGDLDRTFTFSSGKYATTYDENVTRTGKLKVEVKGNLYWLEMIDSQSKSIGQMVVRFDEGKLLMTYPGTDPKDVDFSGQNGSVFVLKREKK